MGSLEEKKTCSEAEFVFSTPFLIDNIAFMVTNEDMEEQQPFDSYEELEQARLALIERVSVFADSALDSLEPLYDLLTDLGVYNDTMPKDEAFYGKYHTFVAVYCLDEAQAAELLMIVDESRVLQEQLAFFEGALTKEESVDVVSFLYQDESFRWNAKIINLLLDEDFNKNSRAN